MPAYPLPMIAIDFNAGVGRNRYAVGVMRVWPLEGLDLHDGLLSALNNAGNGWDETGVNDTSLASAAIEHATREDFIDLMLTQPRVIQRTTLDV